MVFTFLFFSWSTFNLIKNDRVSTWSWIAATILLAISLLSPQILSFPNFLWTKFGMALSRITGPLALLVLFIVVVTPYSAMLSLLRRDLLNLRHDTNVTTYWTEKDQSNTWTNFERQF